MKTRFAGWVAVVGTLLAVLGGSVAASASADAGGQAVAYQVDTAHDGYQPSPGLTLPLTKQWSINLPANVSYPLVVGGVVYVSAGTNLYAFNLSSGNTIWQKSTGGTYGTVGTAYDNGELFVANSDGILSALDPTSGTTNWSEQLPVQYLFSGAPTALNGHVYVSGAGIGGTLYAVSEGTGSMNWMGSVENGDISSPAVSGSEVYVTYACDQDYAFDALTGGLTWHYSTACEGGGGATPVLSGGNLYGIDAVSPNVILSATTGSDLGTFAASTTPAVANGVLYTVTGGALEAISHGGLGTVSWSFAGDGNIDSSPIVAGNVVYVGSSSGQLYAVDAATGSQQWSTNVGTGIAGDRPYSSFNTPGLTVADQALVVPAGHQLSVYSDGTADPVPTSVTPPVTGSAGSTSSTVALSTAAVNADVRDVLKPTGAKASLARVLAHHGYTFSFNAPTVGRLTVIWTAKIAHHKVTIARTSVNVAGASRMKVVLKLTSQGSRDLESHRRLRIRAAAAFSSPGRRTVHEASTFKL